MKRQRLLSLAAAVLAFALLLSGCQSTPSRSRYSKSYLDVFDTVIQIVAYDSSEESFSAMAEAFYDRMVEYDHLYDIYNEYDGLNNLRTVNLQAGIAPVEVDDRILDLLEWGKELYTLSNGKVNIASGSVLKIWHHYRTVGLDDPSSAALPPMEQLEEAAAHTNIDDLIIDREAGTVFLRDAEMSLDVGAIAKGYATEQVCRWAEENGWDSAAVSAGGNVRTIGCKDDGQSSAWKIGLENPDTTSEEAYLLTLALDGQSLVTSGDYQRYYTVDGVSYHHIIDPETLMPATYVHAVSVLCDDSGLADGLSTALFLMSVDEGRELVESLDGVEALWVTMDYETVYTTGFGDRAVS